MGHTGVRGAFLRMLPLLMIVLSVLPGGTAAAAQQGPGEVALQDSADQSEQAARLGLARPPVANMAEFSQQVAQTVVERKPPPEANHGNTPSAGLPGLPNLARAPFSPLVMTAIGGGDGGFNEVSVMGDLDGREDLTADLSFKAEDFSFGFLLDGWTPTRVAMSAHTAANGFAENVYYYGDAYGNVFVAVDSNLDGRADESTVLNLPTVLNAFGTLNSDDQIAITGIGVNPVADLGSYTRVNGSFAPFDGLVGEIVYVSFWDTGGGLRLTGDGRLIRSGVLAFPVADVVSPAASPPAIQSPEGFPVMVGGSFGVVFSVYANLAGVAVDDDGSVYFQNVDLIQFTGGNIVKITDVGADQDRSMATSGILTITTLNPPDGHYGTASGPQGQANRFTNYSGTSQLFGNVAALSAGPNNTLYAAVARSFDSGDAAGVRSTEGPFANPEGLGATPSMIISFADVSGAYDQCSAPPGGPVGAGTGPNVVGVTGSLPIGDGLADAATPDVPLSPGINNFRVFALGSGPDVRGGLADSTITNTLQVDFQVDYTIYSGLTVDEENKVYVISGGTPAGVGLNPSPSLGEILVFTDRSFSDRRADFVDLRATGNLPDPPRSGGNVGDGLSDRYDHIFWQAPLDQLSMTPAGIAGLSRGFLMYLNRTRNAMGFPDISQFDMLPNGATQDRGAASGPIDFELFDLTELVAGGNGALDPYVGDDYKGFEFICAGCVYAVTDMFLNASGSLSFGDGDTTITPTIESLANLTAPKIAPAWADLNPASRREGFANTFPVQALGFAGVNNFKVRWINVPETGKEACGSRNTFAVSLLDDGTGEDEYIMRISSTDRPATEGPTDLHYRSNGLADSPVGVPTRVDGSGWFYFDYGRMDLLGTPERPVLAGYAGVLGPATASSAQVIEPEESDLSERASVMDASNHIDPALTIAYPLVFEFFDEGQDASGALIGDDWVVTPATVSFDLRDVGNFPESGQPANQADPNRGVLGFVNFVPHIRMFIPQAIRPSAD